MADSDGRTRAPKHVKHPNSPSLPRMQQWLILLFRIIKPGDFLLHFEGSYHSNYDQGIIWWINKIQPGLDIKSIATVTQSEWDEMTDHDKGSIANYIIVVADTMTQTKRWGKS